MLGGYAMGVQRKLRPTSEREAKEFVQLCLRQGISREKTRDFLVHLGFNPALANDVQEEPDPVIDLELDQDVLDEHAKDGRHAPESGVVKEARIELVTTQRTARPKQYETDEDLPREARAALAQVRMLSNYRQHGFGWLRIGVVITILVLASFVGLAWKDEIEHTRAWQPLREAKARLMSDKPVPSPMATRPLNQ